MKSKKIVLFLPAPSRTYPWTMLPLSLISVSSFLGTKGYEVSILTAKNDDWKDRVREETKDALLFGTSAMTGYQITEGLEASGIVRKYNQHVPIVWGGRHPTLSPVNTCEHPLVDIVVKGQGESTLLEVAECLSQSNGDGYDLNNVLGVLYKKDGKVVQTGERPIQDPNNSPPYPFHYMDCKDYVYESEVGLKTFNYISSVGCPHGCRFCAEVAAFKRRWIGLKADRVIGDFKKLVEDYNVDGIWLNDSNYLTDKKRALAIAEGIIKENLNIKIGNVNSHCSNILQFNDDEWAILKKSGLYSVLIGAEGGSDDGLTLINKGATIADTIKVVEKCGKAGVKVILSFMVGIPRSEKYNISIDQEIKDILLLLKKCHKISKNLELSIFFYTPYPGTGFYSEALQQGLKEPKNLEQWSQFELGNTQLPIVTERHKKYVKTINATMRQFSIKYKKLPEYSGYRLVRGKTWFRRVVFMTLESINYLIALIRWKFLFFHFPIEHSVANGIFAFKNYYDSKVK